MNSDIQFCLNYASAAAKAIAHLGTDVFVAAAVISLVTAHVMDRRSRKHRDSAFNFAAVAFFVSIVVGVSFYGPVFALFVRSFLVAGIVYGAGDNSPQAGRVPGLRLQPRATGGRGSSVVPYA